MIRLQRQRQHQIILVACLLWIAPAAPLNAFSLFPNQQSGSPQQDLEQAARWSAEPDPFGYGTGLHDGLQVAVAHDFAARLGIIEPEEVAEVAQVIRQAFEAWQTPDLHFDIDFTREPMEGTTNDGNGGFEFDLFAVPTTHPALAKENYFGLTFQNREKATGRLLTNGLRLDGLVITRVDIYINVDLVLQFGKLLPHEQQGQALQRLLMHEIGHGLGLGHPNLYTSQNANFDTDQDPFNPMILDPLRPFEALLYSEQRNPRAILSNDRTRVGSYLFYTELQEDDRGGRDALYPSLIACPADCSGNGIIDVAELITAVNIALEQIPLERCHRADQNADGVVSVDELILGVLAVLDGCNP